MTRQDVVRRVREAGVIAVVRAPSSPDALALAEAIRAGGLPILEITLTVPDAPRVIEQLVRTLGAAAVVGAGTVLDAFAARDCLAAGAQFIVSPVLDPGTIACCRERDVAVMPGALTPTEVLQAASAGADFVKVFPAGALGGASYVRALKAALPHVELVPTGGVTLATAAGFIEAGAAAIGVGSDLADVGALHRGDTAAITATARAYVETVRRARGASAEAVDPALDRRKQAQHH